MAKKNKYPVARQHAGKVASVQACFDLLITAPVDHVVGLEAAAILLDDDHPVRKLVAGDPLYLFRSFAMRRDEYDEMLGVVDSAHAQLAELCPPLVGLLSGPFSLVRPIASLLAKDEGVMEHHDKFFVDLKDRRNFDEWMQALARIGKSILEVLEPYRRSQRRVAKQLAHEIKLLSQPETRSELPDPQRRLLLQFWTADLEKDGPRALLSRTAVAKAAKFEKSEFRATEAHFGRLKKRGLIELGAAKGCKSTYRLTDAGVHELLELRKQRRG